MTLRTKTSVADAVMWTSSCPSETLHIDYQPGNGTKYLLAITALMRPSSRALQQMGFGSSEPAGVFHVHWVNLGRAHVFRDEGHLDPHYVAEKFGCSAHDGAVIAEALAHFTKREARPAVAESEPPPCVACEGTGFIVNSESKAVCPECGGRRVAS